MRLHILKLFLLFVFSFAFLQSKAQVYTCEGALGDPVVSETFGAGASNPGPATTGTDMQYVTVCPEDGQYTLVNNVNLGNGNNCRPGGGWRLVPHDHTGDVNGYMMLINASYTPSVFFTKVTPPLLCGNTIYEFSAYVLNLIGSGGAIQPNLKFSIEALDGTPLVDPLITGDIPPSASVDDWVREHLTFKTRATDNQVVLKITNQAPGGGGNDLLLDDINFRACGPIIKRGFTTVDDTQPKDQCVGDNKSYTVKEELGPGYTNPKVQWQRNIDGSGWTDIPNTTNPSYTFPISSNIARTYQYRLAAAEGDNINSSTCKVFSDPLSITVNDLPVVPDISPASVCEGDAYTITASGGVSYEWEGPGITAANKDQNPLVFSVVTPADAGTYKVTVTSAGGCLASKTTTLTVNKKPVIQGDFNPVSICVGASTQLNVSTPGNVTYSWTPTAGLSNPSIANPIATPADTTVYTVKVSSNADCFDTKTITVNVLPPPTANAGIKKKIFEGQSVTLDATAKNADIYSWSPTDYLSDPTALNPVATPHDDIKYTLTVTSSYNCGIDTSSVFVRVFKKVVIPNTFSPNADGINDTWQIESLETYPQSLLTIFNRYGQQVFKSIGYSKPWKGTYNGKVLPPGTYYYIIDLKNDTPKLTGWVLLVQ
ncbi:gliding motility-associated C-terminal domain-containing protein [Mucilaginibacter pineti]|uniref:Gliding motility-associated C-terminal domain-containing protein n=1 Tax=Mucilaginibacter pineti TaxID=1391627 RepID=A0A1G7D5Q6_9SPHI|nr:gliding motility-associated C-terminal domain-containing protein [Mucilaginibacter pineti]SDE46340.1 gliding motility-associated C-terminal domain-containing protein [Mucilaginibacter pineti]